MKINILFNFTGLFSKKYVFENVKENNTFKNYSFSQFRAIVGFAWN